ncbi:putative Zn-dependent protease [Rubidibacter lacunae KORDI 51-2]|uniref:Putative Zn-dependent protease n=1 Tax=Rubidibacter lacunae KORDI 51-2 TaxID=582515 RepID=U5DS79_9CHRO|nr:TldD/PmbA family protein [Rubidibacter lacunae]ERN42535.1 putative Zn-dependent protease [Rubidibacter lacunae KORDI 51-2]
MADDAPARLLDRALRAGATHAEVYHVQSRSRPVAFEANRLKQLESSESTGTVLRVWRDDRPGTAVACGPSEQDWLVERALALARLNEPEPADLAVGTPLEFPSVGTPTPLEAQIEQGREAIAIVRDAYPEVICSSEWDCEWHTTRLLNSTGLDCQYAETLLSGSLGVEWIRGDDFLAVDYGQQSRDCLDAEAIARAILQRLDWAATNVAPPTGRVPVAFGAGAAPLLWDTVEAALDGKRVRERSSPWSDASGTKVVAAGITVTQEPACGPASCPVDDEGTLTQVLTPIDNGRLQQFYCDRATGRALGCASTGNGFRPGLGRSPTPQLVNFIVAPGRGRLVDLARQLGDGLFIDRVLGGGADISGDFSVNIDLGYRIAGGEIVGRVKDTMVAGNVYSALENLIAIGEDGEWSGSCYTPSLAVAGLSVVG